MTKVLISKYSILNGAKHFSSDGSENYLVLTSTSEYITYFSSNDNIYSWKYKEMSEENINNPSTPDNSFVPKRIFGYPLSKVKFNGNCLKQNSVSLLHKNVASLYITS